MINSQSRDKASSSVSRIENWEFRHERSGCKPARAQPSRNLHWSDPILSSKRKLAEGVKILKDLIAPRRGVSYLDVQPVGDFLVALRIDLAGE
jgi:hypothetical protein